MYSFSNVFHNLKSKEGTELFFLKKKQQIPFLVIRLSSSAKNIYECFNVFTLYKDKKPTLNYLVKDILCCGFNSFVLYV